MPDRLRIALVGCGFYAQNHLHAWRDLTAEGADLVGVCDLDGGKANAAAAQFGTVAFTDLATMLDAVKPQLVDVTTRMDSHRAVCELLAERGIATVVQKPLAPDWETCVAIANTANRHGTFLAVHENFRFQTPMMTVANILASGQIGPPSWARLAFRTGYDVYRTQPYFLTEERLCILDVGIHVLDLARVFLGEVERVSCETQRRNPDVRAEDTATILMRHVSGAVSVCESTYASRRLPDSFPETLLAIEGPLGALAVLPGETLQLTVNGAMTERAIGSDLLSWTSRPWHVSQESVLHTCRHMLNAVRNDRPAATSIADNLKTFALVEAAYASAASGQAMVPKVWSAP
jgi:D-apiose dehydrogenase